MVRSMKDIQNIDSPGKGKVHWSKPSKDELNEIIRGKVRDRIHRQHEYHKMGLVRTVREHRLLFFADEIKAAEKNMRFVKFGGTEMSPDWAKAEWLRGGR